MMRGMQRLGTLLRAPRPARASLDTRLIGEHVMLRLGDSADWRAWRGLREVSREFLEPWEPRWPENALHYGYFCGVLRRHWREWRQDKGYNFLIFKHENGAAETLVGGIALAEIQRGIAQKATLGYWVGSPHAGQGYMTEAAGLVCDFAFRILRLHRVEASCLPNNEPSKKLLTKLGFDEEGYAKAYLQIDGRWQDHILWARLSTRS